MSGRNNKRLAARIDIEHLRFAVAAAEFGSFHKAAEALNVQQSTLSRRIQDIEHATSQALFKRSSGGVVISAFGEEFVRMARAVLEQINEFAPSAVARSRKETLRVGFCTSLSAEGCGQLCWIIAGAFQDLDLRCGNAADQDYRPSCRTDRWTSSSRRANCRLNTNMSRFGASVS
jgi:DNA-binding transcriptional LysR family regulator